MLSDDKLKELKQLDNAQFWPLIKQDVDAITMCYVIYALKNWKEQKDNESFQSFFDQHKTLPEYGNLDKSSNYRIMSNADKFGFLIPGYGSADAATITPVFELINKICKSNFKDIISYQHLIDAQLEKLFVNDSHFKIHTIMFLTKVLMLLGDITGSYSISNTEMKLFVVTATKWQEYYKVVESILRYREDSSYKNECMKQFAKVKDSRYNRLAKNVSFLDVTDGGLALAADKIAEVRLKIANFENLGLEEIERRMNDSYLCDSQTDADGNLDYSRQKIVYGAPGSGKSHRVREEVKNYPVVRVTFHPDTDYSSFVGAYKPIQKGEKIIYDFAPQQFAKAYVEAWEQHLTNPGSKYFLVIEEINRGNCAQIFGDIFQLLDRKDSGYSDYPVDTDAEFASYILKYMTEKGLLEQYSNCFDKGNDSCSKIMFPPSLNIIATMNTSDQSLFPMDSAFKRRWEWEYVGIDHADASQFIIEIDALHQYNWGVFIEAVNKRILKATGSADKQLGNRFAHAVNGKISLNQFRGKVLFYLWDEIFKDNKKHSVFEKDADFADIYKDVEKIYSLMDSLNVDNLIPAPIESIESTESVVNTEE